MLVSDTRRHAQVLYMPNFSTRLGKKLVLHDLLKPARHYGPFTEMTQTQVCTCVDVPPPQP